MNKLDEIRSNNATIYGEIENIMQMYKKNNSDIPKDIVTRILDTEQRKIMAIYLAEYSDLMYDKDILSHMGEPKISDYLAGGLDHDNNTVVLTNMDKMIRNMLIRGHEQEYGKRPDIERDTVQDEKTYIAYMIGKGGVSLDHYMALIGHELRHLAGCLGNADFSEAMGIAEGKTELDARNTAQKYGLSYYLNRNYSVEAEFVGLLEGVLGKEAVENITSFKSIEYSKMIDSSGPEDREAVKSLIELKNRNSYKKDVILALEEYNATPENTPIPISPKAISAGTKKLDKLPLDDIRAATEGDEKWSSIYCDIRGKREEDERAIRDELGEDKYTELVNQLDGLDKKRSTMLEETLSSISNSTLQENIRKVIKKFNIVHNLLENDRTQGEMINGEYGAITTIMQSIKQMLPERPIVGEQAIDESALDTVVSYQEMQMSDIKEIAREVAARLKPSREQESIVEDPSVQAPQYKDPIQDSLEGELRIGQHNSTIQTLNNDIREREVKQKEEENMQPTDTSWQEH